MSLSFVIPEFNIGGAGTPPLQFFRRGFNLNGSNGGGGWTDIILHGNTALTLVNSKANGLNYLKLFGGTEQTGTPTPDTPIDIVCNNGVLKFGVLSTNLLDLANCTDGYYYTPAGEYAATPNARLSNYIPVKAGVTYTVGLTGTEGQSNVRINLFDTAKNWLSQTVFVSYAGEKRAQSITPTQDGFLAFSANYLSSSRVDWNTAQVVQGSYTAETMPEYEPYRTGIYTDGTVETIAIKNNIFTLVGATYDETIPANGTPSSSPNNGYSDYLAVTGGDIYNFSDRGLSGVALYDQNKVFQSRPSVNIGDYTIPVGIAYIRVNFRQSIMNDVSITHTNYTATAEMLLKVGNYQDVQSVLDGDVTRNVGIKVLDGTENDYAKRSDYAINYTGLTGRANGANIYGMCSHFVCSANNASTAPVGSLFFNVSNIYLHFFTEYGGDVASFKAWLTAQYQAGHPVVIIYPLAESTIETVTPQSLNIQAGTNVVEITQASIDNLELEVSYKGKEGE